MSAVMSKIRSDDDDEDLMGKLPDDVLINIIIKLPAETLVHLISVSKRFKGLIKDPQFLQSHSNLSQIGHPTHWLSLVGGTGIGKGQFCLSYSKLMNDYSWNTIVPSFQFPKCSSELRIVGSARGVVCLAYISYGVDHLFLWNPTVNRFITVPNPLPNSKRRLHYGFGFDGDFKIVRLSYDYDEDADTLFQNAEATVYEAKTGCWRTLNCKVPSYVVPHRSSVFVNGIVYWLASPRSVQPVYFDRMDYENIDNEHCIMGFDLAKEVFGDWLLPQRTSPRGMYGGQRLKRLSTSSDGKYLALFINEPARDPLGSNTSSGSMMDWKVWYFINDNNDSLRWSIRYNLVLYGHCFRPLCILNDDRGEVLVELEDGHKCVMNGVKKGSNCSDFKQLGDTTVRSSLSSYTSYTPSLALLEIEDAQQVVSTEKEKRKSVRSCPVLLPAPKRRRVEVFQ